MLTIHRHRSFAWFNGWMLAVSALLCSHGNAATTIGVSEAELRAALEVSDHIVFASTGTIQLSNVIAISGAKRIEASVADVTLSGHNQTRIFDVAPGGVLHLNNLTLFGGRVLGTNGNLREIGGTGEGGAVRVLGGSLIASNCTFATNYAIGGTGGDSLAEDVQPPGSGGRARGAAIFVSSGSLALSNCLFQGNIARGGDGGRFFVFGSSQLGGQAHGAAVYAHDSTVHLQDTTVVDSQAVGGNGMSDFTFPGTHGAGIYLERGTATIKRCAMFRSYARSGGAIYSDNASLTIERSTFATNQGTFGGALFLATNQTAIIACTLTHNSVWGRNGFSSLGLEVDAEDAHGGALYVRHGACSISNSTFAWNTAQGGNGFGSPFESGRAGNGRGGAIFNAGRITLENATITLNRAASGGSRFPDSSGGHGGGLFTLGSAGASLIHCTIASNSVTDSYTYSRGAGCATSSSFSALATIFAHNLVSHTNTGNIHGSLDDRGFNISSDSSVVFAGSSGSRADLDPMLGPLADNGGPTFTMALRPGSLAIDGAAAASHPPFDQRGFHRPAGARADIGAFEQSFLSITKAVDPHAYSIEYKTLPGAHCTLEASQSLETWNKVASQTADAQGHVLFQFTREELFDLFRVITE